MTAPPCRNDPDAWFEESSYDYAKRLCETSCPVKTRCFELAVSLEEGLLASQRHGVWGGATPAERHGADPKAPPKRRRPGF